MTVPNKSCPGTLARQALQVADDDGCQHLGLSMGIGQAQQVSRRDRPLGDARMHLDRGFERAGAACPMTGRPSHRAPTALRQDHALPP